MYLIALNSYNNMIGWDFKGEETKLRKMKWRKAVQIISRSRRIWIQLYLITEADLCLLHLGNAET